MGNSEGNGKYVTKMALEDAVKVLAEVAENFPQDGKYTVNDEFYYLVQTNTTSCESEGRFETHKKYIDIQYMADGTEELDITDVAKLDEETAYDGEKDAAFWKMPASAARVILTNGSYVVLYPCDAHRPNIAVGESRKVKKLVGKLRVYDA